MWLKGEGAGGGYAKRRKNKLGLLISIRTKG